ncbi:SAM-dependent methyltransferase [Paenibacillus sp. IB182496]|uniref:SAM-dependent methyltransferase n=1 Tax=Paenibacillus sabuli TaxID=2772509 RepID=A0A927BRJ8_9BACL|nr:class I SAM-dependent methyltransferase [Paenibacillus sabuli]MBD2844239.1 SAM-dependent methyltransferase [Paenibacillus sabuli]
MGFPSVLAAARAWVAPRLQPGDAAIDATAGGGVDTLFLAEAVGARGTVFAFDIQPGALALTAARLERAYAGRSDKPAVHLLLQSHDAMREAIPQTLHGSVAAAMFNLGYLPGADTDKRIITTAASTLAAMEAALDLLRPDGAIAAVLYPGHAGGDSEAEAVLDWASGLPGERAQSVCYRMLQKPGAPIAVGIVKRSR